MILSSQQSYNVSNNYLNIKNYLFGFDCELCANDYNFNTFSLYMFMTM